jgi:predicted kinase
MRPTLCITRGIPASGKTTWALAWVDEDPTNRVRVNRDDLRKLMFNKYVIPYHQEKLVTEIQDRMVERLLKSGKSVVVDDTNLRLKYAHSWRDLAHAVGADFEVKDFTWVDLGECLRRDHDRELQGHRSVGPDVVRDFYNRYVRGGIAQVQPVPEEKVALTKQYVPDQTAPTAYLFDLDGTLAHMQERGPFDWQRVGEDVLNSAVADLHYMIYPDGHKIIVVSGRDAVCRPQTEEWLRKHEIAFDLLLMRDEADSRKDSIVKAEIFWREIAPHYNVLGVFDDRDQVVEMWRGMGLFCAQVAPGDF